MQANSESINEYFNATGRRGRFVRWEEHVEFANAVHKDIYAVKEGNVPNDAGFLMRVDNYIAVGGNSDTLNNHFNTEIGGEGSAERNQTIQILSLILKATGLEVTP